MVEIVQKQITIKDIIQAIIFIAALISAYYNISNQVSRIQDSVNQVSARVELKADCREVELRLAEMDRIVNRKVDTQLYRAEFDALRGELREHKEYLLRVDKKIDKLLER